MTRRNADASVLSDQSLISWFLDPLAYSFLDFIGLGKQLALWSVVKICFVVFVFPHRCLPLFHSEELFPFSAWKQAAGQQQVSLFLVVRSLGQRPVVFSANHWSINSYCPDYVLSSVVQTNHGAFHFSYPFHFHVSVHVIFSFSWRFPVWGNN